MHFKPAVFYIHHISAEQLGGFGKMAEVVFVQACGHKLEQFCTRRQKTSQPHGAGVIKPSLLTIN